MTVIEKFRVVYRGQDEKPAVATIVLQEEVSEVLGEKFFYATFESVCEQRGLVPLVDTGYTRDAFRKKLLDVLESADYYRVESTEEKEVA